VAQSNDLSAGAKVFYKNSKDMNKKCCTIFWIKSKLNKKKNSNQKSNLNYLKYS